jgi:calcineurin-like phosphoesterase family protein
MKKMKTEKILVPVGRRFFTADHHFGHANILKHQPHRRFQDVEKMDEAIVDAWNSVVTNDDEVYCLGDMSFKLEVLQRYLPYMDGRKILVFGNHDPIFKGMLSSDKKAVEAARLKAIQIGFAEVHQELMLDIPGIGTVKLSHFPYWPINTEGLENYELRYQTLRPTPGLEQLLLHGHIHSNWLTRVDTCTPPMLNVGIDVWDLKPVSEAEIVKQFRELTGKAAP